MFGWRACPWTLPKTRWAGMFTSQSPVTSIATSRSGNCTRTSEKRSTSPDEETSPTVTAFARRSSTSGSIRVSLKGAKSGRTASPVHFLTMKVDSKLANVMDYLAYRRWSLKFCPIADVKDDEDCGGPSTSSNSVSLSDGCRGVEQLVFRMDVATLVTMLTGEERMTLAMRLAGYTDIEIAEALSLAFHRRTDRHRVQKVHAVHLREKARRCGFFPPSEARGREKTKNSFSLSALAI